MPRKEPRNYKKEYEEYHGKPNQRKNRSLRNQARRKVDAKPGEEVDHKKPLSKGGSNAKSNLRKVSKAVNRKKGNKTTTKRRSKK